MFELKLTKRNVIILVLSLVIILGMVLPFVEGVTMTEILEDEGAIPVFAIAFWCCIAAVNLFLIIGRQDFARLLSVLSSAVLLVLLIVCFGEYGRIDGGFFMDNIFSGATLYIVADVMITVLCFRSDSE